jgi:hypothetical protein
VHVPAADRLRSADQVGIGAGVVHPFS